MGKKPQGLFRMLTPRSSINSLKIRMTSHPCNKYEQIMLSYLLSVKHSHLIDCTGQFHLGALCVGIYKWAQRDQNDKRANSIAVSEADLLSVYVP